jgi:hypothetical protein
MKYTRRSFIGNLSIAAMAAASAGSIFPQKRPRPDDLFPVPSAAYTDFYLSRTHFEPLVNTTFEIGSVKLTLKEVTQLGSKNNEMRGYYGEAFSLLFDGPRGLPSGTHQMSHPAIGEFPFFITAVGNRGTTYEVIVNRIRK